MDKVERVNISNIREELKGQLFSLRNYYDCIKKKVDNLYAKFPEHKQLETLEHEAWNLECAIDELELADAFIRQALEGLN